MSDGLDTIQVRRLKIILLVSSLASLVLLLLAAFEENLRGEWRRHQAEYRTTAMARAQSDTSRAAAEEMEIGFKQVFLPQLNRVDRCTNCHVGIDDPAMADMELPIRAHSGNVFEHHPLDKFGCTVCHDGQGRAVDAEVAHGEVEHWPAPLLRGELVYTSCSRCHYENDLYGWEEDLYARGGPLKSLDKTELAASIPAVGAPRSLAITRGKQLVQRSGCLGCHKYRGRGGTLGPEITYVGDKTVHDFDFSRVEGEHTVAGWLYEHFKKPGEVVPGTLMPDVGLTDEQAGDLTHAESAPQGHAGNAHAAAAAAQRRTGQRGPALRHVLQLLPRQAGRRGHGPRPGDGPGGGRPARTDDPVAEQPGRAGGGQRRLPPSNHHYRASRDQHDRLEGNRRSGLRGDRPPGRFHPQLGTGPTAYGEDQRSSRQPALRTGLVQLPMCGLSRAPR
jgi:cytochrome c2